MLISQLNGSKIFTNKVENINKCKNLFEDYENIIFYKDYISECFSGSLESIYKVKYQIGIVLPLAGPNTVIGNKFKEIMIALENSENRILASIHPQSDNGWSNLIKNFRSIYIRNHKNLSDIKFISICEKIIGAESSLKSLAKDLNKSYSLID